MPLLSRTEDVVVVEPHDMLPTEDYPLKEDPIHCHLGPAEVVTRVTGCPHPWQHPREVPPHLWPHNAKKFETVRFTDYRLIRPPRSPFCRGFTNPNGEWEPVFPAFLYTTPYPRCKGCAESDIPCVFDIWWFIEKKSSHGHYTITGPCWNCKCDRKSCWSLGTTIAGDESGEVPWNWERLIRVQTKLLSEWFRSQVEKDPDCIVTISYTARHQATQSTVEQTIPKSTSGTVAVTGPVHPFLEHYADLLRDLNTKRRQMDELGSFISQVGDHDIDDFILPLEADMTSLQQDIHAQELHGVEQWSSLQDTVELEILKSENAISRHREYLSLCRRVDTARQRVQDPQKRRVRQQDLADPVIRQLQRQVDELRMSKE